MFRTGNAPELEQSGLDRNKERRPGEYSTAYQGVATQNQDPTTSLAPTSTSRAIPESESLAREIKDGNLSGYVGHGTVVKGETSFKGMMRIDGHVGGKLTSEGGSIIVGDGGQVDADLEVAVALIRGVVNGDIVASQRVELGRTAKVRGNIHTASLTIDQGAYFEGTCRMAPILKQADKSTAETERVRNDRLEDYDAMAASLNAAVGDNVETSPINAGTDIPN